LDSKIVANIKDNKWVLNPNNYFRRNYDKFALEVIDDYGVPILQIELVDLHEVIINGIFIMKTGYHISGANRSVSVFPKPNTKNTEELLFKYNISLQPYFVYGEGSLGKRAGCAPFRESNPLQVFIYWHYGC
jgi:hypothetical protein